MRPLYKPGVVMVLWRGVEMVVEEGLIQCGGVGTPQRHDFDEIQYVPTDRRTDGTSDGSASYIEHENIKNS